MNANNKDLEDQASANENLSKICGWAVVAGLVIEVILAAVFRGHASWIENWAPVFADVLIALGVFGEIHFAGKVSKTEEELRRRSAERVSEANARADEARLETEKLRAQFAQFAWRRLSPAAIAAISQVLAGAQKCSVAITYVGNDPETTTFAHDLGAVFTHCGWSVGFISAAYAVELVFGIRIPLFEPPNLDVCWIARAALSNAGIEYSGNLPPNWVTASGSGTNVISPCAHIYIGPKPPPVFE